MGVAFPEICAPKAMSVMFAEDYPKAGIRLIDEWWPGRLLVAYGLLIQARRGETRGMTFDGDILTFALMNATATYRLLNVRRSEYGVAVAEFDCLACSRDIGDG